jgi:hypothetical protein
MPAVFGFGVGKAAVCLPVPEDQPSRPFFVRRKRIEPGKEIVLQAEPFDGEMIASGLQLLDALRHVARESSIGFGQGTRLRWRVTARSTFPGWCEAAFLGFAMPVECRSALPPAVARQQKGERGGDVALRIENQFRRGAQRQRGQQKRPFAI